MEGCIKNYKHKFYFVHATMGADNMIGILNSGYIKLGKDVPKEKRKLGGPSPDPHVYSYIYFDDIDATPLFWSSCLILKPSLICDYGGIFHEGWRGKTLVDLDGGEGSTNVKKALDKIRRYLKKYNILRRTDEDALPWVMSQEFLFDKKISVKDYVIGLALDFVSDEEYNKIKNIVDKKGYNITIIRRPFLKHSKKTIQELEALGLSSKLNEILKKRGDVISGVKK